MIKDVWYDKRFGLKCMEKNIAKFNTRERIFNSTGGAASNQYGGE
jgi:hypothetical protein